MSQHTPEAQKIKRVVIDKLLAERDKWLKIEKSGVKISSANKPKNYNRMARLIAGGKDSLYMDEIEKLLSSGASADKIRNKIRTISETEVPNLYRRTPIDQLHHIISVDQMQILANQEPDVMLDFLYMSEDKGWLFSDDPSNLSSFIKPAHAPGAMRESSNNPVYDLGIKADNQYITAHSSGTNKGVPKELNRKYSSGKELFEAMEPLIRESIAENQRGVNASVDVNKAVDNFSRQAGINYPGSIYDKTQTPETIAPVQQLFKNQTLSGNAVAQYNGPKFQDAAVLEEAGLGRDSYNARQMANAKKAVELYGDTSELVDSNGFLRLSDLFKRKADVAKLEKLIANVSNPAMFRMSGLLPVAGTALGAGLVDKVSADRDKEIKENPNDPSLKVNKALDQISGNADRLTLAGMATAATGLGAIPGAAMIAAGEVTSLTTGLLSLGIDATRGFLKLRNSEQTDEERLTKANQISFNR